MGVGLGTAKEGLEETGVMGVHFLDDGFTVYTYVKTYQTV